MKLSKYFRYEFKTPMENSWKENLKFVFEMQKFPNTNSPLFKLCSALVIAMVGTVSKALVCYLNNSKIYNKNILESAVENRPAGQPLLTVANHHSCFDDPAFVGIFKYRTACSSIKNRWSMAAHDICFTKKIHSKFFMYGKCIPVIRGEGVYQPAVDLCVEKLRLGEWVHIFPEGKVNMTKEFMRLKWGVGRVIYEYMKAKERNPVMPIIIPIWHEGMEILLPNYPPYYFRLGQKLTFNIGNPINLTDFVRRLIDDNVDEVEARRLITDEIQNELMKLKDETEKLHSKHLEAKD